MRPWLTCYSYFFQRFLIDSRIIQPFPLPTVENLFLPTAFVPSNLCETIQTDEVFLPTMPPYHEKAEVRQRRALRVPLPSVRDTRASRFASREHEGVRRKKEREQMVAEVRHVPTTSP